MISIVTMHYRYRRPPKKRAKAAAIEGPVIVTIPAKKRRAVSARGAIVTAQKPGKVSGVPAGLLPDTPEEHQRRGDTADALFRGMKRRIAEKPRP